MRFHLRAGFSLVEYILYISLTVILIVTATDVVFRLISVKNKQEALEEVTQNGREVFERILITIRNATNLTTPAKGTTSTTLGLTWNGVSTTFSLVNGAILYKEGALATSTLTTPDVLVSSLLFRNVSATGAPAIVRVTMTVSSTNAIADPDAAGGQSFLGTAAVRSKP